MEASNTDEASGGLEAANLDWESPSQLRPSGDDKLEDAPQLRSIRSVGLYGSK